MAPSQHTFTLRPAPSTANTAHPDREAFRARLTATSLLSLKLKPGDLCSIRLETTPYSSARASPERGAINGAEGPVLEGDLGAAIDGEEAKGNVGYVMAWESSAQGMKDSVVQVSKTVQELAGLKLGDRVIVEKVAGDGPGMPEAEVVRLQLIRKDVGEGEMMDDAERRFWEFYAGLVVKQGWECLAKGVKLKMAVGAKGVDFVVAGWHGGSGGEGLARVGNGTGFEIVDGSDEEGKNDGVEFMPTRLGGLDVQVDEVRRLVDRLLRPRIPRRYAPAQGLLLYGAKGVGKSLFVDELAASGWQSVLRWSPGMKIPSVGKSILIAMDQLDLPTAQGGSKSVVREIDRLFQAMKGKPCLIVGETRHPNDVDSYLRSEGKFSIELEIPIPSALQRRQILAAMRGEETMPEENILDLMAQSTHGYVGADLHALLRRTLELASERLPESQHDTNIGTKLQNLSITTTSRPSTAGSDTAKPLPSLPSELTTIATPSIINGPFASSTMPGTSTPNPDPASSTTTDITAPSTLTIHPDDLTLALTQIRPSALQEIFLETPTTRWSDIGGLHATKRLLSNAVSRPLTFASRMASLNLRPKKGVLLYGPPGCSKTLLVRALAREAGLNFLAVKGAELISMYVGESERATREVFRKARAAAPAIVFFDEIDAIASSRAPGFGGGSSSDLNVLTTLLNEMDGFETLRNVFVVAATNKPAALDPALLRPGRFDNLIYIPPPDLEARREIFARQFAEASYQGTVRGMEDDVYYFAEKTQGYTGAEIVAIVEAAKEYALDSERDWFKFQDVEEAVRGVGRGVGKEVLEGFESWGGGRGG